MVESVARVLRNDGRPAMLTTKEVAGILGIHQNTVRRWSNLGLLKSVRISYRGDRRYNYEDIVSFLDAFNGYDMKDLNDGKGGGNGSRND